MDFLDFALFFGQSSTLRRVYGGGPGCFTSDQPVSETKISIVNRVSPSLCRNFDSAAPGSKKEKLQNLKSDGPNPPPPRRTLPDLDFGPSGWVGIGLRMQLG